MLSKEEYQNIIDILNEIKTKLKEANKKSNNFIDNSDFCKLMKISSRTAQTWRDEGKISFSQIGKKIYYSLSDIEDMLKQNSFKAFKSSNWKHLK